MSYEARQDQYCRTYSTLTWCPGCPTAWRTGPRSCPACCCCRGSAAPRCCAAAWPGTPSCGTRRYTAAADTATSYLTCGIGQRGEESKDTTEASMQPRSARATSARSPPSPSPSPPCHRRGDRETTFSVNTYLWVSSLAINQFSESQPVKISKF